MNLARVVLKKAWVVIDSLNESPPLRQFYILFFSLLSRFLLFFVASRSLKPSELLTVDALQLLVAQILVVVIGRRGIGRESVVPSLCKFFNEVVNAGKVGA